MLYGLLVIIVVIGIGAVYNKANGTNIDWLNSKGAKRHLPRHKRHRG